MDNIFMQLFIKSPQREENGIYYFGNENDGDCFDNSDFDSWQNGIFYQNWRKRNFLENHSFLHLLDEITRNNYVIDLACGPGMGFIPSIKQLNPVFPCMATDANPFVLSEWKHYLDSRETYDKLGFAQFSAFSIPIKSNAVQAYSSFIGISSTRNGENGYAVALSEIHRTLAKNGLLYAIENEWADVPAILSLFERMNQQPWSIFSERQISWHDRFIENGFEIVYEETFEYRSLKAEDNELGSAAVKFGVDIGMKFTAYIVRKRSA